MSLLGVWGLESGRGGLGRGRCFWTVLSFWVTVFFPLPNMVTLWPRSLSYSWKAGSLPVFQAGADLAL